ncbi:hypothetical protein IV203_036184 [Nitzschia inconspicua]|uniref:Uncharacterized protein n=1 Tax=Nitzschia inconspicua TaxID=303405 RepID=A0A9K3LER7_9STRA|nr:hypothetical protein IV203_036184 [Nitzschia inconspicua]
MKAGKMTKTYSSVLQGPGWKNHDRMWHLEQDQQWCWLKSVTADDDVSTKSGRSRIWNHTFMLQTVMIVQMRERPDREFFFEPRRTVRIDCVSKEEALRLADGQSDTWKFVQKDECDGYLDGCASQKVKEVTAHSASILSAVPSYHHILNGNFLTSWCFV